MQSRRGAEHRFKKHSRRAAGDLCRRARRLRTPTSTFGEPVRRSSETPGHRRKSGKEPAKSSGFKGFSGHSRCYLFGVSTITVDNHCLELNEEGFLAEPAGWDESVAAVLARSEEGIEVLTEKHWAVIRCIRGHYLEKGLAPMVRLLCQQTGLRLREIYDLFPSGPAKGACKVAGLPKPDGCV